MKRIEPRHSTVPKARPPKRGKSAPPPVRPYQKRPPLRADHAHPPLRIPHPKPPKTQAARIIDDSDSSLVDVLDNLLNKGVMLNADLILALADVDLVYVRLSALLCAADRVLPLHGL